jgi:hypothetical protein
MKISTIPAGSGRPRMRTREAAAYLGSTKSTLDKWRGSGKGPRYSRLNRIVVYDPDELDRFAEERVQSSTAENNPPRRSLRGKTRKTPPASAGTAA